MSTTLSTDGAAREAAGEHPWVLRALAYGVQAHGLARAPAVAAARDGFGMRGAAVAAEVEGRSSSVQLGFGVFLRGGVFIRGCAVLRRRADQVVDEHHALAVVRCVQRLPPSAGGARFAARRLLGGEAEALRCAM